MKDPQREVEELRAGVNCATVLEKATPPWLLDRKESSKRCLKYRRGAGEIVIVTHGGAGWWDPNSDAKGDVFRLVAAPRAEPQLRRGAEDAAAPGRGSTRFRAGRACARQARPSNPGRSEMGPAPAAETLLRCLALSREPRTARSRADRGRAMRRRPRRPPRLRLVRPPRSRRPRHPRRRPRPDLQGLSDRRLQEPLLLFSRQCRRATGGSCSPRRRSTL